jgi:parallel beta-helix repeat protein
MESSNNNTVRSNIISNNAYGIDMFLSDNNTIVRNIISGSQYGISLDESKNNTAHHNNFLYNKRQVDSFQSSDTWDNGTQGNYWTDYTGTDANSDGIGDTPYLIPGDNPDRFPLMKPWGIIIDNTQPTTTNDYDGSWHTADFAINLTAYDDISSVKATCYKINGASAISNVSANGQPGINTEGANNTLEYWSIDGLSNEEKPHHNLTDIKLDKTPPSGSILINNGEAYTTSLPVTLNLSATDPLSGMAQMRFSSNGTSWSIWENYNTSKAWNLTSGDGLKSVYVEYRDKAGAVSQPYSATIILDTVAPTVSITSPPSGSEVKSSNVIIQWNGTDAGSGIDHFEIQLDHDTMINVGDSVTTA